MAQRLDRTRQMHNPALMPQQWGLGAVVLLGLLLPLPVLATSPMHPDEALYATWARLIATGSDPWLNTVPVDKPPLFMYLLALVFQGLGVSDVAARLPSLVAHLASLMLIYQFGRRVYSPAVGLLAALLLALSPYSILFAATALTDSSLVFWVLAASVAAVGGRAGLAGLGLGLAGATKQQAVFFLPLIVMLLVWQQYHQAQNSSFRKSFLNFGGSLGLITLLVLGWDAMRTEQTGFWLQSSLSYGGLSFEGLRAIDRLPGYLELLTYAAGNSVAALALGIAVLLRLGVSIFQPRKPAAQIDGLLAGFCFIFLGLHLIFTFQIWDRYLLGLVPLLALLAARGLLLPAEFIQSPRPIMMGLAVGLALLLLGNPAQQAVRAGYPIGGDHGAFAGTSTIATYLQANADSNVTLYHRWLGTHWRYYLFRYPYDLRYWDSAADLAQQATANAAGVQYIAFPAWQSRTPAELALTDAGLCLKPVFITHRPNGTPAVTLYRVQHPDDECWVPTGRRHRNTNETDQSP